MATRGVDGQTHNAVFETGPEGDQDGNENPDAGSDKEPQQGFTEGDQRRLKIGREVLNQGAEDKAGGG